VRVFPSMLSEAMSSRSSAEKYLGPGEHVICTFRRHSEVLDSVIGIWLIALVLCLTVGLASRGHRSWHLSQVGAAVFLAATVFLGEKVWQWWMARYVFTNDRVLLIEGILSRRVNGLPLRMVLDTTYHRTLAGRLRGYGDLELNLSGQPGLRRLKSPATGCHIPPDPVPDKWSAPGRQA